MPVTQRREVKVTNQDVRNVRSNQEIVTRPESGNSGRPLTSAADMMFLRLHINVSPFFLCLTFVIPLILWTGTVLSRQHWWLAQYVVGLTFANELRKSCPPDCTWHNLLMWAILGGVGLLMALLFASMLRRRLLLALNRSVE